MNLFAHATYRSSMATNYIIRTLSSTSKQVRRNWAEKGKLPRNPNKSGPLTYLPDYTFMDGRISPLGANQQKRLLQQRELATKIVILSKEMDFAVNRHNKLQEETQEKKKLILERKLKAKGHLTLNK